jgi:hypothetical protein
MKAWEAFQRWCWDKPFRIEPLITWCPLGLVAVFYATDYRPFGALLVVAAVALSALSANQQQRKYASYDEYRAKELERLARRTTMERVLPWALIALFVAIFAVTQIPG